MLRFSITFVFCLLLASMAHAQVDPASKAETKLGEDKIDRQVLFDKFADLLKKSVLVGTFTVDSDEEQKRREERYEISKVVKAKQGDYWNFFARIQYGKHDVTLPIPVEVKWAGKTPVITVDNLTIPAMGTFDARVVISDGKYAGTWRHGKVGGLMFGHIEKQEEKPTSDDSEPSPPAAN